MRVATGSGNDLLPAEPAPPAARCSTRLYGAVVGGTLPYPLIAVISPRMRRGFPQRAQPGSGVA